MHEVLQDEHKYNKFNANINEQVENKLKIIPCQWNNKNPKYPNKKRYLPERQFISSFVCIST